MHKYSKVKYLLKEQEEDTNKSSATQTTASNNHGRLAFILSHSVLLIRMLQSITGKIIVNETESEAKDSEKEEWIIRNAPSDISDIGNECKDKHEWIQTLHIEVNIKIIKMLM